MKSKIAETEAEIDTYINEMENDSRFPAELRGRGTGVNLGDISRENFVDDSIVVGER